MQLKTLALSSAIVAVIGAIETHDGYQYEARFSADAAPETNSVKNPYETAAAQQAYTRLQEQIAATGVTRQCLTEPTGTEPDDLYTLKDCIAADNPSNFFTLLADDIKKSNSFWVQVVQESTTNRTQWVPARAYTKCYFNGSLTATQFAAWTLSENADAATRADSTFVHLKQ